MRGLCFAVAVWALPVLAQEIRFTQVASGISGPTAIQNAADGTGRLFLVQQNGLIRILRNGSVSGTPFLDIRTKTRAGGERGLLGLAFPPGFATKQRFYVNYTDLNGDTTIAMYRVTSDPNVADAGSEAVLLKITQPYANHNGGGLQFGPDGYLYIGMGDGGSGGDPQGNGQNRNTLLGKMLRIDVEADPGRVRIPSDNPFATTSGARGEIWAYGLRNPWGFSFDRANGDLWIADVGQDTYEEINYQPASSRGGENYGWVRMEGLHCFRPNCDQAGLILPVAEYSHTQGCSVTGGHVYRGPSSPGLRGTYIYGDYCSGRVWGVDRNGTTFTNRLLASTSYGVTAFGEDEAGEVYIADAGAGIVYRIEGSRSPRLASGGVVNAASFVAGVAPGSLATAFVTGVLDTTGEVHAAGIPIATALRGVSLTVGGVPAPIHSLANLNGQEQVNFQVPFEVRGRQTAPVIVTRDGQSSSAVDVPVLGIQPAIYTSDGTNAVVVRNADYSLVTANAPLVAGEFVFAYAAGVGRTDNEPTTGAAAGLSPTGSDVRVSVGGIPADVQYAGFAPGFVGVYQVNFRVPAAPSGTQNLVMTVAGTAAPTVKVPVR
jgi:uncharacterized protein (TIGR03437 family)